MEAEDEVFFIRGDMASLDGGAEVVHPPEAAALPAAEEPRLLGQRPPPSFAFPLYVIRQQLVLLRRPRPSLQPHLAAAWRRLRLLAGTTTTSAARHGGSL